MSILTRGKSFFKRVFTREPMKVTAPGSVIEAAKPRETAKVPEMRTQLFKSSPGVQRIHDMLRTDPHGLLSRVTQVMSPDAYKEAHGIVGLRGPSLGKQEAYVKASNPFVMKMENGRVVTRDIDPTKLAEAKAGLQQGEVLGEAVPASFRRVQFTTHEGKVYNLKLPSPRRMLRAKDVVVGKALEDLGVEMPETVAMYGEVDAPKGGLEMYGGEMNKRGTIKFYMTEVPKDTTRLTNLDTGKMDQILHNKLGREFDSAGEAEKHEMRRQLTQDIAVQIGRIMCDLHNISPDYEAKLHGPFATYAHEQNFAVSEKDGKVTPVFDFTDVMVFRRNENAAKKFTLGKGEFSEYEYKTWGKTPLNRLLFGSMDRQKKEDTNMIATQLGISLKSTMKELGINKDDLRQQVLKGYNEQWDKRDLGEKPDFLLGAGKKRSWLPLLGVKYK